MTVPAALDDRLLLGEGEDRRRLREDPAVVTCARCGTTEPELPVTWSSSVERGRTVYYCAACSRENVRAIEGRLDSEWW